MTSTTTVSAFDEAVKLVCAKNIHQHLWLPKTSSHDRLRVTFSTTSNFSDANLPAILFCVPMFGSRYYIVDINNLAVANGVRVISVDRPGMGGSTPTDLDQRIAVWLETVPALLKHLNVGHVSIMSHSAGTMYALNTLYHLRHLLDPVNPYAGLIAPWVSNSESNIAIWNIAATLPTSALNAWSSILGFVNQRVMPVTAWSGGVISSSASLFSTAADKVDDGSHMSAQHFGVESDDMAEQISKLQGKYKFAESITAVSEEVKLCLKKGCTWGICDDYEQYVRDLVRQEKESPVPNSSRLSIDVFFGETDMMIGKAGQTYFERCWQRDDISDAILFKTETLAGTDHETTVQDHTKGAVEKVFKRVKEGRS